MKKENLITSLRISADLFEAIKNVQQGIVLCHVADGNRDTSNGKIAIAAKIISSNNIEDGIPLYFHGYCVLF